MNREEEYEIYIYDGHIPHYGRIFIRLTKTEREHIINNLFYSGNDIAVFDMFEGQYKDIYCGFIVNTIKYGVKL